MYSINPEFKITYLTSPPSNILHHPRQIATVQILACNFDDAVKCATKFLQDNPAYLRILSVKEIIPDTHWRLSNA